MRSLRRPEGFLGIQMHAWFAGFSWGKLLRRELTPPYIPPPFDAKNATVRCAAAAATLAFTHPPHSTADPVPAPSSDARPTCPPRAS